MESIDWSFYTSFYFERYAAITFRGALILGGMYLLFWTFKRPWMEKKRIPTVGRSQANPKGELFYVLTTYLVYALSATKYTQYIAQAANC